MERHRPLMGEFARPEGDPESIRSGTRRWGNAAGSAGDQKAAFSTSLGIASADWKGPRKVDFTDAADGLTAQLDRIQAGLSGGIESLDRYAATLEDLQAEMASLRHQATSYDDRIDAARSLDPISAEAEISAARSGRQRLLETAHDVRDDQDRAARRAADALDHAVDLLLPGGARLAPRTIRHQVHAANGVHGIEQAIAEGRLTAAAAWAALESLRAAVPTPDWKLAAVAYGLDFPATMDRTRGLALKAQLYTVLDNALSLEPGEKARLVREFADTLSEADQLTLAYFDRMRLGNLDGIPNTVRYAANRLNLADGLASEKAKLAAMVREFGAGGPDKGQVEYVEYQRLLGRIKTLGKLLDGRPLNGDTQAHGAYQVLAFQPPTYDGFKVTDDGRLAVAIGDLDQAAHIGVAVPGITNRIDNFAATYYKAENTQKIARDSATIAWLGYDTPELADSVTTDDAETGGAALASFIQGLQREPGSDVTIMAHSYGTLATSKALQIISKNHWNLPDRVVLFGSPGLGENIHNTRDLGLPPGYPIYALRAPGDPVSITAAHGTDPCDIPGITQLATHWAGTRTISGHSKYTQSRSGALMNIAGVLAGWPVGKGDRAIRTGGDPLSAGFAGAYNANVRDLVDRRQAEVDPRTLSRFIGAIEADVELAIVTKSVEDPSILIAKVWAAAHTSGMTSRLTHDELTRAIKDAGFTRTLGHQADGAVTTYVDRLDGLDGIRLPIIGPGGVLFRPRIPGGINEAIAGPVGDASGFLTRHIADIAVDRLPSLTNVLGAAETIAVPFDAVQWANGERTRVGHLLGDGAQHVKDAADSAWDSGTDFADDRWEDGKDLLGQGLGLVGLE